MNCYNEHLSDITDIYQSFIGQYYYYLTCDFVSYLVKQEGELFTNINGLKGLIKGLQTAQRNKT